MAVILHIITTLDGGGAEAALTRLVLADRSNSHHVIGLRSGDANELKAANVPVYSLDLARRRVTLSSLARLSRLIRQIKPDVIQTWMYHADLLGGLVARVVSRRPVLWGIRNANLDPAMIGSSTRAVARTCALLSHVIPSRIVSCSSYAARLHADTGYDRRKLRVVPNGYDLKQLAPDPVARVRIRAEWNVRESAFLFGMVARWDRQKDHATLFAALCQLTAGTNTEWDCVLIGSGMSEDNHALTVMRENADLSSRVLLAGPRNDMPAVMSALDVHVLASHGEGFPNVVAEAMACGTPCIVTDVGDAAFIVAGTGWVVPPCEPARLAQAMTEAMAEHGIAGRWSARRNAARTRVLDEFNIERMVRGYHELWAEVM